MCCNGPEGDAESASELRRNNYVRLVECMGRVRIVSLVECMGRRSPIYVWRRVS